MENWKFIEIIVDIIVGWLVLHFIVPIIAMFPFIGNKINGEVGSTIAIAAGVIFAEMFQISKKNNKNSN